MAKRKVANGRRRTLVSLLHGAMANAMRQALGRPAERPYRPQNPISPSWPRSSASRPGASSQTKMSPIS